MLISSSIPNFVNGVSQQPFTLRLNSQGEVQENGLSTVSQGLKKRPPSQHLKKIASSPLGNCYIHTINRDSTERYVAVVTNGDLKIYGIDGTEKTVNFPNGKGYLSSASPSESFSAVTVADYTFLVNKGISVTKTADTTSTRPYEALVNVKAGNYGKTYIIKIDGSTVASYSTPNGSSTSDAPLISTDHIAASLLSSLNSSTQTSQSVSYSASNAYTLPSGATQANFIKAQVQTTSLVDDVTVWSDWTDVSITWTGTSTFSITGNPSNTYGTPNVRILRVGSSSNPWNAARYGSTIYLSSSTDFALSTEDGFNNGGMVGIKKQLQKFADLPPNAGVDGFVVEITGTGAGETASAPFDNYYVRYSATNNTGTNGVWKESAASGILKRINSATMPHLIVREADGTFTFKVATWSDRIVGDDESNPFPSFVGKTISDVFFYRNRLGLLSDEAVIFSEAGKYFNFGRTTVTQLLDSDPIDVNASHTKVALLKHAVPFNKQLLLFSEQTQFVIDAGELLTPKSIGIKVSTEFPCNVVAKPVGIGRNIYFAVDKGEWSSFREYYADTNSLTNDSLDVTGHLPKYIPSGIFKISAAPNEDIISVLASGDTSSIYIYKYFFANNDKLQSSWSKWTFGTDSTILNAEFIDSSLYLVINRADGVYLEKVTVSIGDIGVDEPYTVHLDRKVGLSSGALTYSSGYTTINLTTLGYTPSIGSYQVVVKDHASLKAGEIYDVIWDGTNAKVAGNITGAVVAFGRKYNFKYQLSTIALRTAQSGGGQKSDTEGRLQLRKISFNYADTGYFKATVTPAGRETYTYTYSGKVLGEAAVVGRYSVSSGRFLFPIVSRNIGTSIVLENDSPLPSSFLSADWEGFYVKRSKAV